MKNKIKTMKIESLLGSYTVFLINGEIKVKHANCAFDVDEFWNDCLEEMLNYSNFSECTDELNDLIEEEFGELIY